MRFKGFSFVFVILSLAFLTACSTNPATGEQQFTALMSPQQETKVGASEHQKIIEQYGLYNNAQVNSYVSEVGRKVTQDTERPDVAYKFFVLDSPIVNAFALPGGYIYISRGLLALANNEAELAAVLAHETGHITGRHSAERYSRGVVTSLGAGILSAVLDSQGASQALGVGANLYLSSYSRGQENEADSLGLRYMTRGGYDPAAMSSFLNSLKSQSDLDAQLAGRSGTGHNYFSTHPATGDRVNDTRAQATQFPSTNVFKRDEYLRTIDGLVYGDSADQGFVRGTKFYHPKIGFMFEMPDGFAVTNQPTQVVGTSQSGSAVIFDMASGSGDPAAYIQKWVQGKGLEGLERITVNGRQAATASFAGQVNGQPMTVRLVAIEYGNRFARFQIAIPSNANAALLDGLKKTTYSFRTMTDREKQTIKPYKLDVFTAKSGDTVENIASKQPFERANVERFRVLNGLNASDRLVAGRMYKRVY